MAIRLSVRKSGEVILGMSELEAVTLIGVIATVVAASAENTEFFGRTEKAVLRDLNKQLNTLDEEIDAAEKRGTDSDVAAAAAAPSEEELSRQADEEAKASKKSGIKASVE